MSPCRPIDSALLESLRDEYRRRFGFELLLIDPEGRIIDGREAGTPCTCGGMKAQRRRQAISETLRWGECTVGLCCDDGFAIWGAPLMHNQWMTGGLVVEGIDLEADAEVATRVRDAAPALLEMLERENLLNGAALTLARQRSEEASDQFKSIEASKHFAYDDLRTVYLREEPALLTAIKSGGKAEARAILNRVLTGIYSLAGERLELLKSCVLELIIMMSRAAVEAGASPSMLLGTHYRSLTELAEIEDEEDLATWIRSMLERLIDAIRQNTEYPNSLLLSRALRHMEEHLHDNLRRDEVARIAGISPSHFSHLMTERLGRPFSEILTQMRVQRACMLLRRSPRPIADVALSCGFCDQSYFSKVFRKHTGYSPGDYRNLASTVSS